MRVSKITAVLRELDADLDDMFPEGMEWEHGVAGVYLTGNYKGCGVIVSLYFAWSQDMSNVRILFLGRESQRIAIANNLRAEISRDVLMILERVCIAQDAFHLYVPQKTSGAVTQ